MQFTFAERNIQLLSSYVCHSPYFIHKLKNHNEKSQWNQRQIILSGFDVITAARDFLEHDKALSINVESDLDFLIEKICISSKGQTFGHKPKQSWVDYLQIVMRY